MIKKKNTIFILSILLMLSSVLFLVDIGSFFFKKNSISSDSNTFMMESGAHVAVLNLQGSISDSSVQALLFQLQKIQKNPSIKGVLLRVNSPGGTTGASEEVYSMLMSLRKKGVKIITSIGDLAASGGFYIASASNLIIAKASSLTGSIGVIISTMNVKGLADKYGVKSVNITSGKMKDMLSPFRDMRDDERIYLQKMIMEIYDQFIDAVLKGRNGKITKSNLLSIADGRVLTGIDAKKYGLIDVLGGFSTAVEEMKKLLKVSTINLLSFQENNWKTLISKFITHNKIQDINIASLTFLKNYSNIPLYYSYISFNGGSE